MIVKITKGTGLRGLLNYLSKDAGRRIGGNMAGQTPRELAAESSRFQQLRPNLKKKVAHFSLSLHPGEGRPTDEQWTAICDAFLVQMGFAEAPHTIFRHDDTSHAHVHIAALRIDPSGAVIPDANDFRRAEAAARQIENQFGLRVLSAPQKKTKRSFDMKDEIEMVECATPTAKPLGKSAAYGCSAGDQPSERRSRDMRRVSREPDYEARMRGLFGNEVRGIKVLPRGAVVYFKDGSQLRDDGDRFSASHMNEADAAQRLVKSALDRGWTSAVFTGSDQFLREAFRVALDKGLDIHPTNSHQARILAEVKASFSKPAIHASPSIGPSTSTIAGPGEGFKPRLDALRRSRQEMEEQFRRNKAPRINN